MPATERGPNDYAFNLDMQKYITILVEQKGFVLVFCIAAVLSSLALTYIFSEKYLAATTLYYRPLKTSLLREQRTESFGAPVPSAPFKVIVQTLNDIIKNEAILRPIVGQLNLDKTTEVYYPEWYRRWYHWLKSLAKEYALKSWSLLKYGRVITEDETVAAIKELRENLSVQSTKDSYIYILSAKDNYPERAAKIVDTAGHLIVEWLKNQDRNPAEQQIVKLREQISEKEAVIGKLGTQREKLLAETDITSVSEETVKGVNNLYELELERVRYGAQRDEKRQRMAALKTEIENGLRGYIHPDDIKKMESERLSEEVSLEGLTAKINFLESSIAALKEKLRILPSVDNRIQNLEMKIDAETREYLLLKDLYLETLSQTTTPQSEARVLHAAVVPAKPVQPIKIYHLGLTALLAFFVSTGLVYVFAFFNIRIFFASKGVGGRQSLSETTGRGHSHNA